MKQHYFTFLLTILMSIVGAKAFAYEFAVTNTDGVTIYYVRASFTAVTVVDNYPSETDPYTGNVVIPKSVFYNGENYTVEHIDEGAFSNCSGLTSVIIPNSVTSIGRFAFANCTGLTSITIPTSVTYIEESAFSNCTGLTSITIPNSVTSIGEGAFDGCTGLTSITIPNSVTSIGDYTFDDCRGLTSMTIPNSVTSIGKGAFRGCYGLTSITIPNSVTSIGDYAFQSCIYLTSITIPNSVTSIGDYAFNNSCAFLTSIVSLLKEPFGIFNHPFDYSAFNHATLYVPKGTIDKYKATDGWKDFLHIEEGVPAGINEVRISDTEETGRYTLNGSKASNTHKGLNIVRMSDGKTKKVVVK